MIIEVNTIQQNITPVDKYPLSNRNNSIITGDEVKERLIDEIPYNYTMYIIGGLVNRGLTNNDIDIYINEKVTLFEKNEIEKMFIMMLKYRVHIINVQLDEEKWSPIYMYKIYSNGKKINY